MRRLKSLLPQRAWNALFWCGLVAAFITAVQPAGKDPAWFEHADKLQHALAFAGLARLGLLAGLKRRWALGAGLVLFGIGIELAQWLTATRHADVLDALADAAGAGLALAWRSGEDAEDGR
ncbi:putative integral membrane protein [Burkholderiales bacterium JOSHI_001]|nr:putative integral membrane protein [Burkholderiales bacterium JOSHI_001]